MNKKHFIGVGDKFGYLVVLSSKRFRKLEKLTIIYTIKCLCTCGKICYVKVDRLIKEKTKSCGCKMKGGKYYVSTASLDAAMNVKLNNCKTAARYKNYTWELTDEFAKLLMKSPCYYCGKIYKNKKNINDTYRNFNLNGIDRLNNSLGYTITNSVSCCKDCNIAKGTKDVEEFLQHIEDIYKFLNLGQPKTLLELSGKVA